MSRRLWCFAVTVLLLAGCTANGVHRARPSDPTTPGAPSSTRPPSHTVKPSGKPSSSSRIAPSGDRAARALAGMGEAQRVGQLLMVDCPSTGVASATRTAIERFDVGAVILDGTSELGAQQTATITRQLQQEAPPGMGLFVASDQEGGQVQRLQGPGFSSIPSAAQQGSIDPAALRRDWTRWGGELRAAGVNVDLGPVLDTVPPGGGPNPPIGDLDREYGHDPATVSAHATAVVQGLTAAGIDAAVKHFPGLGRVAGNTDTSAGVLDTVTTRHDAYLAPFAAAVRAGVPFVMMSTAIYARIDPDHPAAFSRTIVTGMLRGDLGFTGVIISDDIGAAKQVSGLSPGGRAVAFVAAGGDLVLTVDATQAGEMTGALLAKAQADPAFRKLVDAAALRVLRAKAARGLLR